jgi:hypothetical protein
VDDALAYLAALFFLVMLMGLAASLTGGGDW